MFFSKFPKKVFVTGCELAGKKNRTHHLLIHKDDTIAYKEHDISSELESLSTFGVADVSTCCWAAKHYCHYRDTYYVTTLNFRVGRFSIENRNKELHVHRFWWHPFIGI